MGWWRKNRPATMWDLTKLKEEIKMDMTQLRTDLAALVAQVGAAETKEASDLAMVSKTVSDLKAQVAAGGTITQADLDALDSQVTAVAGGLTRIVTNLDEAAAAPAGTPPAGTPAP